MGKLGKGWLPTRDSVRNVEAWILEWTESRPSSGVVAGLGSVMKPRGTEQLDVGGAMATIRGKLSVLTAAGEGDAGDGDVVAGLLRTYQELQDVIREGHIHAVITRAAVGVALPGGREHR